jgi:hypothetical protein
MSRLEKQKQLAKNRARDDCKAWARAVESYKLKYGDWPTSLHALTQVQSDGTPPFMEAKSLYDPWGHEYMYEYSRHKPDVYSWGPRPYDPNGIIGNWE